MHTARRPVPSKAALRALRQLAYVASGTACGAAAIVYEERRRRIRFFKQVAENGRIIRSFADKGRHESTAATVLEGYDPADAAYYEPPRLRRRRARSRTLDDLERGTCDWRPEAQEPYLPSRVERGYEQLTETQHGPGADMPEQVPPPELADRGPFPRSLLPELERAGRRPTCYHPEALEKWDAPRPKTVTQAAKREATSRPWSELMLAMVEAWSRRFQNNVGEPAELSDSWGRIHAAAVGKSHDLIQALLEAPLSEEALIRTSLELELPTLLMQVCEWADRSGSLMACAKTVATTLLTTENDRGMFDSAVDWLEQRLARVPADVHGQDTICIRLSLLTLLERADVSPRAELLFEELKFPNCGTIEHLKSLLTRHSSATALILACLRTSQMNDASKVFLATWTTDKLLAQNGHFDVARRFVCELRKTNTCSTQQLLVRLWQSANEPPELLDMFALFDLAGIEDKAVLGRLSGALFQHGSSETAIAELYGTGRSRLWTAALVQSWHAQRNARSVVKQFWNVQRLVGTRPLDPVLYDSVLCIGQDADLASECAKIERYRKTVIACTSNDATIAAILKASRASAWATVRAKIAQLKIEGFGTMQQQKRMRLFDPVFEAYAKSETDVRGLFLLALELSNRICTEPTPTKTLRLLSSALVRAGKIDTATRLRRLAKDLLHKPLLLTPIDVVEELRSYYYAFRPTTAVLADLIRKLCRGAWNSTSRLCIPLLLISASYEAKFCQQKRIGGQFQDLLTEALSEFDRPSFRRHVLSRGQKEVASDAGDSGLSLADYRMSKTSGPLVFELTGPGRSSALETEKILEQVIMAEVHGEGGQPSEPENGPHSLDEMVEALEVLVSEISPDDRSQRRDMSDHLSYWKAKSLMHASNTNGDHDRTLSLLQDLIDTSPVAPSATLTSLGISSAVSISPAHGDDISEQLQPLGTDLSLARLTKLISQLSAKDNDSSTIRSPERVDEIKEILSEEYAALAERGHHVTHSLATALANTLLDAKRPAIAIEILQHALKTRQASQTTPGPAVMLSFLKAYLMIGHMEGVRWVMGHMLSNNEHMNKNFAAALKRGQCSVWNRRGLSPEQKQQLFGEINLVKSLCLAKREDQIKKAWDVGNELVQHLIANVPVLDKDASAKTRKGWVDAKVVETVCGDIMTISQRSWHHSKQPRETAMAEHLRIRKPFVWETDRQRGEVEMAA